MLVCTVHNSSGGHSRRDVFCWGDSYNILFFYYTPDVEWGEEVKKQLDGERGS